MNNIEKEGNISKSVHGLWMHPTKTTVEEQRKTPVLNFFKMILRNIFEHNMELPDIFLENLDVYRRMNTPLPNPLPLFLTHVHQRIHSYSHNTIYALLSK